MVLYDFQTKKAKSYVRNLLLQEMKRCMAATEEV